MTDAPWYARNPPTRFAQVLALAALLGIIALMWAFVFVVGGAVAHLSWQLLEAGWHLIPE